MSGPVVVGVDGTAEALRAVRWAAMHAELHDTGLWLVHAAAAHGTEPGVLAAAEHAAADARPGVPVTTVTGRLPVGELLVRESMGATLVVLGGTGHGGFFGGLVGDTAVTVAAHAPCPMVVAGAAREPGSGPVVVGVDGTRTSDAALDFALREASLCGTDLTVVHAGAATMGGGAPDGADERTSLRCACHPGVKVVDEVATEAPGRTLLRYAVNARLVVVGSARRIGHPGLRPALDEPAPAAVRVVSGCGRAQGPRHRVARPSPSISPRCSNGSDLLG